MTKEQYEKLKEYKWFWWIIQLIGCMIIWMVTEIDLFTMKGLGIVVGMALVGLGSELSSNRK